MVALPAYAVAALGSFMGVLQFLFSLCCAEPADPDPDSDPDTDSDPDLDSEISESARKFRAGVGDRLPSPSLHTPARAPRSPSPASRYRSAMIVTHLYVILV